MADFDYDGPSLDYDPPRVPRPFVPPVQISITGDRDLAVLAAFDVIRLVFTVANPTALARTPEARFRIDAEISRDFPLTGGVK